MNRLIHLTLLSLFLIGCRSYIKIGSVKNNVCKSLEKKTVLFAVFVDSDRTHPWSAYDINSTLDSIQVSIDWLEKQAVANGISLDIILEHGINASKDSVIPFKEKFKYESLSGTLFKYKDLTKGIDLVDAWSDNVSKDVARSLPKDTSELVLTKNKLNNRERLIAKLRNQYKTDNIALMFFINNYFENEISVAFHTSSGTEIEYAIVSKKQPTVIVHEFLHLFGACDLYLSPFDHGVFPRLKKRRVMKRYPNEIMAFTHKNLDSLNLSPLTKYLIGWENQLDKKEGRFLVNRRRKVLEY
ncbi:hypothetical protein SAMN05216474_2481 [Lishizhenia tianjinensis]|uniref:Lipoprotein n=1 Tax=Lishizhenia tianjinensis TaxID=477690 RepID=A0A1I7B260_9FLAO|nr:hypothetical protein [Lishizhenia tianjinensis]SFT81277.1 hypothetical protein SAMN05216474_2481 [Lishizhenia tianjinensis]